MRGAADDGKGTEGSASGRAGGGRSGAGRDAVETAVRGVERLHRQCAHLIVVSNEVFRGGADYAGDTARYLLALARVNNAVAARADHVCRVVCGLPRWVKGGDEFGRA